MQSSSLKEFLERKKNLTFLWKRILVDYSKETSLLASINRVLLLKSVKLAEFPKYTLWMSNLKKSRSPHQLGFQTSKRSSHSQHPVKIMNLLLRVLATLSSYWGQTLSQRRLQVKGIKTKKLSKKSYWIYLKIKGVRKTAQVLS